MKPPHLQAASRIAAARRTLADAHRDLVRLAETVEDPDQRGAINALLWDSGAGRPARDRYFSQYGQDAYLDTHVFGGLRGGTFVEVGGHDGVTGSNCLYFEIFRGWSGLMIEAVEAHVTDARRFRRCECVGALLGEGTEAEFLVVDGGPTQMSGLTASYEPARRAWIDEQPGAALRIETRPTERLGDILAARGLNRIDLMSLDIEGAELAVLQDFPFDAIELRCLCVETVDARDEIAALMGRQGFVWIDRIGQDDLYVVPDLA